MTAMDLFPLIKQVNFLLGVLINIKKGNWSKLNKDRILNQLTL